MAVTTLASPRVGTQVDVPAAPIRTPAPRSGVALLVALVAVCAYAVFAHGAVGLPEEPRLQIGLAFVGVGAAVGLLLTRTLALRAPVEVWIGIGLLAGFAVWCGVTLLWSVAPEQTWAHVNRAVAYTLVVVLALTLASSLPRALERLAYGWLAVALACALYALGGKIIPGAELLGIDFDHTAIASRLRAPLEYWNALGLVMVLAIPIALRLTTDATRRAAPRMAGIAALFVLLVCLGMTYSRGGILAFGVTLAVLTLLGGPRLRGLAVIGVTIVAAIPVLGLSFSRPALKGVNVPLDERTPDGILLGLVAAGCLLALLIAAWGLLRLEERTAWNEERTQLVWRGLAATAAIGVVLLLGAIATYEGGPGAWADDAWTKFTETSKDEVSDPARIVSSNSGNRWVWWEEAAGAWSDKPLQGWGAGSFAVTHRMYRQVDLSVVQPHNMPLQFLAETGIIGTLLVTGGLGFLFFCAFERLRGMARGRERDLAVALFAGAVGWLAHGFVDWDWDIPGVTVPALLFLGVLGATPWRPAAGPPPLRQANGARGAALALVCVAAALLIVSAGLPMIADRKASSSQAVSADADADELRDAAAQADLAARLDPTAVRPLLAAAAIAEGRDRLLDARRYLLRAVERQPYNSVAWQRLLQLALKTADRPGAAAAARRLRELDPIGAGTLALTARLALFDVPAASSPTATGTPLSPRFDAGQAVAPAPDAGPAEGAPPDGAPTPPAGAAPAPGMSTGRQPNAG
ncbi:MAG: O-antigen ligase family protein [Solirubrobacteraceae bacterium]|nr:O-antigen ligase family protein [Solirubrobacteraceae bacterium]